MINPYCYSDGLYISNGINPSQLVPSNKRAHHYKNFCILGFKFSSLVDVGVIVFERPLSPFIHQMLRNREFFREKKAKKVWG